MEAKQAEEVLEREINPALRLHGGGVRLEWVENGRVHLHYTGACAGCMSASFETEDWIREELQKKLSWFRELVIEQGVSDQLLQSARALMKGRAPVMT